MNDSPMLIALDLDGTLLDSPDNMSIGNVAALEAAHNAGNVIAVVTGRPPAMVPKVVQKLSCIRYISSATGAAIWDKETGCQIAECAISTETAVALCRYARKNGAKALLSYGNGQVLERGCFMAMARRDPPKMRIIYPRIALFWMRFLSKARIAPDAAEYVANCAVPPLKCELVFDTKTDLNTHAAKLERFSDLAIAFSEPHSIELTSKNATKGVAIAQLCKTLGFSREQTIGFGDSGNDITMREAVGSLVAMGNACDELKSIADFVSSTAVEDGVAFGLRHFGLA